MATPKQIAANRANAKRSTGPKTSKGKRVVSKNALKHGVLAHPPVLPFVERLDDWNEHVRGTRKALSPEGYVEELLVERVALLLWKLARLRRYERDLVGASIVAAERDLDLHLAMPKRSLLDFDVFEEQRPSPPSARLVAEQRIAATQGLMHVVQLIAKGADPSVEIGGDDAACLLDHASEVTDVRYWRDEEEGAPDVSLPDLPSGESPEDRSWTISQLRRCLEVIAAHAEVTFEGLLRSIDHRAVQELAEAKVRRDEVAGELERYRRLRVLPDADARERLMRYEVCLERSLYRALHELERRQSARAGGLVVPPVAVDVTLEPVSIPES